MSKKLSAIALAAALIGSLALTGCSKEQTAADACTQLTTKLKGHAVFDTNPSDAADPAAMKKQLEEGIAALKAEGEALTNPEVKKAVSTLVTDMEPMPALIEKITADPTAVSSSGDSFKKMQASSDALQKLCPDMSTLGN